jgi:hypothetical protein
MNDPALPNAKSARSPFGESNSHGRSDVKKALIDFCP